MYNFLQLVDKSKHEYLYFILLINLNAVFCIKQMNDCTEISRATKMFPWGSDSAKRLKTTALFIRIRLKNMLNPTIKNFNSFRYNSKCVIQRYLLFLLMPCNTNRTVLLLHSQSEGVVTV